jgi:type II secretion system protein L
MDMLDTVLGGAIQSELPKQIDDQPKAAVSVMFYLDAQVAQDQAWIQNAQLSYPDAEYRQMADGTLPQLAAGLQGKNVINFLQGAYTPRSDWQRALKPWRRAALLAASLLITVSLVQAVSLWRLSSVESDLDAALAVTLRQVFPGNSKINDPRRELDQLRQSLRGGPSGSSSQFLDTVIALGGILPKLQDTRVEAASYRNQVLELRIKVPDVTTLDRLEREMEDSGHFQISIQSANPRDDGVEGRIAIARSGS